jgi:hypothetical protein
MISTTGLARDASRDQIAPRALFLGHHGNSPDAS